MNTRDMEGLVDIEDILAGDMAILERCDFCVTTLPFDSTKMRDSVGTQKEIERCKKLKIPVYESLSVVKLNEE
ncbi:hypothetical protein KAR91_62630 [Candidatus Pacearchaeota archaeon]|nr:hypothetical protein [Candidatus Pacearchaeota archaeon]